MVKVLEAVPNISEGRKLDWVRSLVDTISDFPVDVLDWSCDPDHNRSVVTFIGDVPDVEEAALEVARAAARDLDLNRHRGVHPRVGALDVLPFVPLEDATMQDAVASARRVGRAIGEMGVPVYYYGAASDPPGRGLAELRKGGFEALREGLPTDRPADEPEGATTAHPTAGVTCVGARRVLLAWNVFVDDLDLAAARRIASRIRERDGGFPGLRALGLELERQERVQVSMNLEDPEATSPLAVFDEIDRLAREFGGRVSGTEIIGMMPETLVLPGTADRLQLPDLGPARVLSRRVAEHVQARVGGRTRSSDTTG